MHRTFRTSAKRRQTYLDGTWDFVADPNDVGLTEGWHAAYPKRSVRVWVPGVWNTNRAYLNYEGVGWFRTRFTSQQCAAVVVHFAAVTQQANVWLDGDPLGEHYGGFLPFRFLLGDLEPGGHELVVRIDNTHDMASTIPSAHLDWFRYGGITRPVWTDELQGPGYIDSLRLLPVTKGSKSVLRVRAELVNLRDEPLDETWTVYVDENPVRSDDVHVESRDIKVLRFAIDMPDVRLWSPDDPQLYLVRLSFAGDDCIERTGFREIRIAGHQVLLNGEPLRILGVNRHEDHPDWGSALPPHLMLRDLELLQSLGANAMRGSHYPNDQRMLDLCDERGILFMEEIPLWGYAQEQLSLDIIGDRASAMMWAMVGRAMSHPCIWAWSVLNECATDTPEGRAMVERLAETAREADPTRPVTFASHHNLNDICFDLVDLVCSNAYYGWYWHDLTWPEFLDLMRAKIGDKPLIVSEFGAGAIFGCHALEKDVVWSEEYQRKVLTAAASHLMGRDDLIGFYIWQFFDTRTDTRGGNALRRPRGYNNKGLLDEYRRPKLAYHAVQELLRGTAGP